jgi:hypothetical protein
MDTTSDVLKSILERLESIETLLETQDGTGPLRKSNYSCAETARLTEKHGIRKYRPFTIRLACSDGRIPEADKLENGSWRIPQFAVYRILEEGIPPERRNGHSAAS